MAGNVELNGMENILGDLVLLSGNATGLKSNTLRRIRDFFDIEPYEDFIDTSLRKALNISFPSLAFVTGVTFDGLVNGSQLDFSGLETISDFLVWNTTMSTLELNLVKVAGQLQIVDDPRVSQISLPLLETVGWLIIHMVNETANITMPRLQQATTGVEISNVSSINLDSLSFSDKIELYDNSNLTKVSFPELSSATTISIRNNSQLSSLEFSKLHTVKDFHVVGDIQK